MRWHDHEWDFPFPDSKPKEAFFIRINFKAGSSEAYQIALAVAFVDQVSCVVHEWLAERIFLPFGFIGSVRRHDTFNFFRVDIVRIDPRRRSQYITEHHHHLVELVLLAGIERHFQHCVIRNDIRETAGRKRQVQGRKQSKVQEARSKKQDIQTWLAVRPQIYEVRGEQVISLATLSGGFDVAEARCKHGPAPTRTRHHLTLSVSSTPKADPKSGDPEHALGRLGLASSERLDGPK